MDDDGTTPPAGWDDPALDIDLIDRSGLLPPGAGLWLVRTARRALAPLRAAGEVRVAVVGDDEMARLNAAHHATPGTTDVLTFDFAPSGGALDADIIVCLDEARRQAAALGHALERELLLYIVHGVLHCLGHSDADEASAAEMHRREDELLAGAGVGPTFAPAGRAGP